MLWVAWQVSFLMYQPDVMGRGFRPVSVRAKKTAKPFSIYDRRNAYSSVPVGQNLIMSRHSATVTILLQRGTCCRGRIAPDMRKAHATFPGSYRAWSC
jgi:hypothetical protein